MKLGNLKTALKLALAFGAIVLAILFLGIREILLVEKLEAKKDELIKAYELADAVMESKYGIKTDQLLIMEIMTGTESSDLDALYQEHGMNISGITGNLDTGIDLGNSSDWGRLYKESKDEAARSLETIKARYVEIILPMVKEIYDTKTLLINESRGRTATALNEKLQRLDTSADSLSASMTGDLDILEVSIEDDIVAKVVAETEKLKIASSKEVYITLFIVILFSVIITIVTTRAITVPLKKGVEFATRISEGDLRAELDIDQKDEIGKLAESLKNMVSRLRLIIAEILNGSEGIASASMQMSSLSQEMSAGANEQASSVEEVSATMEEVAANIQQNSENAQQTEKISVKAANDIEKGSEAVLGVVEAIRKISERISIIGDIAEKTDLLAINASIEAARAGEHGKGFAVVAAEIRKLAENTSKAAIEITELSSSSVEIADKSGAALIKLVPDIKNTATLVQEISVASLEQNNGVAQVNMAIQQFNSVTQQNASASEELSSSAEELAGQAEQLKETVAFFKV